MLPNISSTWKTQPLGEVCTLIMGQAPKGESYNDKGIGKPLIAGAADLGPMTPMPKKWTTSPTKLGKKGDIILCVRATIGYLNWADSEYCYGRGVSGIRANKHIDPHFLWFWLEACKDHLLKLGRGATFKQISKTDIAGLPVPDLDLTMQQRIVAHIEECMEKMEEIDDLRAKVYAEASFLAPSLYASIEDGNKWIKKKVGELIIRSRNGRSIKQDSQNANGHVLSLAAVHDVTLNLTARKPIVLPDDIAAKYSISVGDVFVSRSNTRDLVGLASVANQALERVIYPDLLIKLETRQDLIRSRFLAYALRTPESRKQIKDRAVGTSQSMVKISGQRLRDVEVPVPPLDVQDVLIERFDELHDLASGLIGNLRFLNSSELRQSILRKAFAGEL